MVVGVDVREKREGEGEGEGEGVYVKGLCWGEGGKCQSHISSFKREVFDSFKDTQGWTREEKENYIEEGRNNKHEEDAQFFLFLVHQQGAERDLPSFWT